MKVLIVDHNEIVRDRISSILTPMNIECTSCKDSVKAIDLFVKIRPDVVFLDAVSAFNGGKNTLSHLLEINSSARIIIMSHMDYNELMFSCYRNGAQGYLIKPFQEMDILLSLSYAIYEDIEKIIVTNITKALREIILGFEFILDVKCSYVLREMIINRFNSNSQRIINEKKIEHTKLSKTDQDNHITLPDKTMGYVTLADHPSHIKIISFAKKEELNKMSNKEMNENEITYIMEMVNKKIMSSLLEGLGMLVIPEPLRPFYDSDETFREGLDEIVIKMNITSKENSLSLETIILCDTSEIMTRHGIAYFLS